MELEFTLRFYGLVEVTEKIVLSTCAIISQNKLPVEVVCYFFSNFYQRKTYLL